MRIDLGTLSWLITWFHFDLCRKCIYGNMRAGLVAIELVRIDLVTPSRWLITWFHFDLCRNASTRQATCILWIVTSSPRICLSMTLCSFRNLDLHSLTWNKREGTHMMITITVGCSLLSRFFPKLAKATVNTLLYHCAGFGTHSNESWLSYIS